MIAAAASVHIDLTLLAPPPIEVRITTWHHLSSTWQPPPSTWQVRATDGLLLASIEFPRFAFGHAIPNATVEIAPLSRADALRALPPQLRSTRDALRSPPFALSLARRHRTPAESTRLRAPAAVRMRAQPTWRPSRASSSPALCVGALLNRTHWQCINRTIWSVSPLIIHSAIDRIGTIAALSQTADPPADTPPAGSPLAEVRPSARPHGPPGPRDGGAWRALVPRAAPYARVAADVHDAHDGRDTHAPAAPTQRTLLTASLDTGAHHDGAVAMAAAGVVLAVAVACLAVGRCALYGAVRRRTRRHRGEPDEATNVAKSET